MRSTLAEIGANVRFVLIAILLLMVLLGLSSRATTHPRASGALAMDGPHSLGLQPRLLPDPGVRTDTKFEVLFYQSELLLP